MLLKLVYDLITELEIVQHPKDIDTIVGMPITLRCKAEGKHHPIISWNKDDKPLDDSHVILRKESIRIQSAITSDQGMYTCIAKDTFGMVATSRSAKVTVLTGITT